MATDVPTILATTGSFIRGSRTNLAFGPLIDVTFEIAGPAGRPRLCYVGTATGDQRAMAASVSEAGVAAGVTVSHLSLFPMPSVADPAGLLLDQDVIWVGGGSVANLLALWRLHHIDEAMRAAWEAGVILAGSSAGSICWHVGGTTDSFGPDLELVDDALGFVPFSNGVHYDSEPKRRPLFQQLIAERRLPAGYATDEGVGLVYRGTELRAALADAPGKSAWYVCADGDVAVEERIEARALGNAHHNGLF
jgi:peptidase E